VAVDAAPIPYMFVGASATFAGGTANLSGGFTFETSNHTIQQISVTVTGFLPCDGTYDSLASSLGSDLGVVDLTNSADMSISFANSLYAGAPDPMTFVQIYNSYLNAGAGHVDSLSVTGSAVPAPEPSALALLGAALAAFALLVSRRNNPRSARISARA